MHRSWFPPAKVGGLIEARSAPRRPAWPVPRFRRQKSAASLKLYIVCVSTRRLDGFRRQKSAASLKHAGRDCARGLRDGCFRRQKSAASLKRMRGGQMPSRTRPRFRRQKSAASLKLSTRGSSRARSGAFPPAKVGGLIEAPVPQGWTAETMGFRRQKSAASLKRAAGGAGTKAAGLRFRRQKSAASLKRAAGGAGTKAAGLRFRRQKSAASLKRYWRAATRERADMFPPAKVGGLIEALLARGHAGARRHVSAGKSRRPH